MRIASLRILAPVLFAAGIFTACGSGDSGGYDFGTTDGGG